MNIVTLSYGVTPDLTRQFRHSIVGFSDEGQGYLCWGSDGMLGASAGFAAGEKGICAANEAGGCCPGFKEAEDWGEPAMEMANNGQICDG